MREIGKEELKYSLEPYVRRADSAILRVLRGSMENPFVDPLIEFTRGGKKIRPALLLLVNEAVGGGGDPDPAAAAVELIHTASLIHDDIIDDSNMRRDFPSFHVKHGIEMAILIADFILSLVLEIANGYSDKRVGKLLSETTKLMSIGEMMEVISLRRGSPISLNEYLRVLEYKTASLFRAASSLGALIAGKDQLVERMGSYGLYLGLAYQIKDDILDWGEKGELTCLLEDCAKDRLDNLAYRFAENALDTLSTIPESHQKRILEELVAYSVRREE